MDVYYCVRLYTIGIDLPVRRVSGRFVFASGSRSYVSARFMLAVATLIHAPKTKKIPIKPFRPKKSICHFVRNIIYWAYARNLTQPRNSRFREESRFTSPKIFLSATRMMSNYTVCPLHEFTFSRAS